MYINIYSNIRIKTQKEVKNMPQNEVKIQETKTGQLIITIPRPIAAMKGWKKGTKLQYHEDRYGELTLKEVPK